MMTIWMQWRVFSAESAIKLVCDVSIRSIEGDKVFDM